MNTKDIANCSELNVGTFYKLQRGNKLNNGCDP